MLDNGYRVRDIYYSNQFKKVDKNYLDEKHEEKLSFLLQNYELRMFNKYEVENTLNKLYPLFMDLYSDFAMFKAISKEQFIQLFSYFKEIIDERLTRFIYYKNELIGFFITIKNFSNLIFNINFINYFRYLKIKYYTDDIVMLHIGIKKEHKGIGKTLSYYILKETQRINVKTGIGALIHENKVTKYFYESFVEQQYRYVLMEK